MKEIKKEMYEEEIKKILKKIDVKGKIGVANYMSKTNQLRDFPMGEKIYVKSRGIKNPPKIKTKYQNVIDVIDDNYNLDNESTVLVRSTRTDNIINVHKKEVYKKK